MNDKNKALPDFMEMIRSSWTWDRLTDPERERFARCAYRFELKGTYNARWELLHWIYDAFLEGCGYEPIGWREPDKDAPRF